MHKFVGVLDKYVSTSTERYDSCNLSFNNMKFQIYSCQFRIQQFHYYAYLIKAKKQRAFLVQPRGA